MGLKRQEKQHNYQCQTTTLQELTDISHYAIHQFMADVVFTAAASRQWLKLTPQTRKRIRAKLDAFARTGQGDIKKLTGQDGARLRVGDWRVIFYQDSQAIVVIAVGHRREIYD